MSSLMTEAPCIYDASHKPGLDIWRAISDSLIFWKRFHLGPRFLSGPAASTASDGRVCLTDEAADRGRHRVSGGRISRRWIVAVGTI